MKIRIIIFGLALSLIPVNSSFADSTSADFPYSLSFQKEAIFFGIGGSLTASSYYFSRKVDSPTRSEIEGLDRNDVNRFDRTATYHRSKRAEKFSYVGHYVFPVAFSALYLDSRVRDKWATLPVMYLEGFLICETGLTDLTKSIVQRRRPYLYNTDISTQDKLDEGVDGTRSFFSGHASFNFYTATFISKVFCDMNPNSDYRYAVIGATCTVASFVGFMRYEAGKHYPSDILVGAAVGSLVGYLVPALHLKRFGGLAVSPVISHNYKGLVLTFSY